MDKSSVYKIFSTIALCLGLTFYFVPKAHLFDNLPSFTKVKVDDKQLISLLNDGMPEIQKAIVLRDKLVKEHRDWNKEKNIPELEARLPILSAYYREAVKNIPNKQAPLEKIIKQIKSEFDKKSMALWKWNLFHIQLNALFTDRKEIYRSLDKKKAKLIQDWGNLNFKKLDESKIEFISFPWYIYNHNGLLGLKTLNYAFISDIMVLAMPTDKDLEADGRKFNPLEFTVHDQGHFEGFKSSSWASKRFKDQFNKLYNQIEQQTYLVDRARNHFALFMLIHESFTSGYAGTFKEVLEKGKDTIIERFAFYKNVKEPKPKDMIYDVLAKGIEPLFEFKGVDITPINKADYKVTGNLEKTPNKKQEKQFETVVTLNKVGNKYIISYKDPNGKMVVKDVESDLTQLQEFIPIINMLGVKLPHNYTAKDVAENMIMLVDKFVRKYEN